MATIPQSSTKAKIQFQKLQLCSLILIFMIRLTGSRLNTSRSVLTQESIERGQIPWERRSLWLLNSTPSCSSVVYLSLCLILFKNNIKKANGNLWPLSGLSCGTSDEEEHFICCALSSRAHGIGQCLLLAILMTSKFDMKPLGKASCLSVALCLSPEILTTACCSFD